MCSSDLFPSHDSAPSFVLLFHALLYPVHFHLRRHIVLIGLLLSILIAVFSYSTVNRTQESQLGTFNWLVLFEYTGSTENLKINQGIAVALSEHAPSLFPAVFLTHYMTHSLAELANIISNVDKLQLGGIYYLKDQLCVIGVCSVYRDWETDRKSTRLNSSHITRSRMPSSA